MRKFCFGILSVVCMLCFNSCGSNEVVYTLAPQKNENQNFENFLKSIDSLNYTYTAHTRAGEIEESLNVEPDKLGPEEFKKRRVGIVCAADWGGRIAGHFGGRWVGGILGGAVTGGTPLGVVAGTWLGTKYGGHIGSTVASAIAGEIMYHDVNSDDISSQDCDEQDNVFVYNSAIKVKDCDSLGYYHNRTMYTLLDNQDKYIDDSKAVNLDLLYDDIIDCVAELLGIDAAQYSDTQTKQLFIEQVKSFYFNGQEYTNGDITFEEMLEKNKTVLINNLNVDSTIASKSTRIASSVLHEISAFDEEKTQKYAEDLNSVINKSSLSEEDRELVRINSEILINSKLCWAANVNKIVKEN